jgi:hypothetical protein
MDITLKDYLQAINYKVTGGSSFEWNVFGSNAYQLESADTEDYDATYTVCVVFDKVSQKVYELQAWDYLKGRTYRWVSPDFTVAYDAEYVSRGLSFEIALDNEKFINLDVAEDILEKITAIAAGEEYDDRVQIEIDLPDDVIYSAAIQAHKQDITLNQYINNILINALENN